ncbi:MAG TPA: FliH/SctL family protein [Acidobacteriaceae bacterium]|nr:FliH/SctL family protein [Acidobacteriaceae bacterium]
MPQEAYSPDPPHRASARKDAVAAPIIERLEYHAPGLATEKQHPGGASPGAPSNGAPLLVEEWMHPTASERSMPDATTAPIPKTAVAEERWVQERASLEARLVEQKAIANREVIAAQEEGRREGHQIAEAAFAEDRERLQQQIVDAVEEFRQERERYFYSVEREVVRLALAIAARVLHRQAQMDPLFLSGAVRVALDKLADTSGVVLRVAPGQVPAWQAMFGPQSGLRAQPEILGDGSLNEAECILETRLGTVELGVGAQLEEIEKGFFDLLHHHPAAKPSGSNMGQRSIS